MVLDSRMSLDSASWSRTRQFRDYLLQLLLFLAISIVLGSIIVICVGENPLRVYTLLIREGFLTPRGWMIAIQRGTPLILTSAAATLAFQAGAINMGISGQFMVGGAFAAIAGYAFAGLPKLLHIPLALLVCAAAGAAAGFIPAFFKRISGVNEVITGMIANLLMPHLLSTVIGAFPLLREAQRGSARGIPLSAQFRQFVELTNGQLGTGTKANTSVFLAIIIVLFLAWWMKHSKLGFELRMTRANYPFAEFAGIRASRSFFVGMMLSGAVTALAGATEVLGVWRSYRLGTVIVEEKGLVLSLIGGQSFIGSMIAAILYGGLEAGAMNVAWNTAISRPLLDILLALIVVLVAVPSMRTFFTGTDIDHLGGRFVKTP